MVSTLIKEILAAARSGNQFDSVYKSKFSWFLLFFFSNYRAMGIKWRRIKSNGAYFQYGGIGSPGRKITRGNFWRKWWNFQVITIFSDVLMKRICTVMSGKRSPQQRVLRNKVIFLFNLLNFCTNIPEESCFLFNSTNFCTNIRNRLF